MTTKRCQLKQSRLNYQPLFRKGAHASKPDTRDQQKLSLKMEIRMLTFSDYHFSECTLKDILTAKNSGV